MRKKAFTLIELAISLAVIGLMIGGSFQAVKTMRERNKVTQARNDVKSAKDAVIGFAMEWVDLPTLTEFNTDLSPIKNANIKFFYFPAPSLSNDNDICAFNTTELNVSLYDAGSLKRVVEDVAFVVASRSANNNLQTGYTGTNPYDIRIDRPYDKADYNSDDFTRVEEYDDIVKWVTLAELQNQVGCSDKPFRFLNDKLPSAEFNTSYSAQLYVENNISSVTITCTPASDKNISSVNEIFSGIPDSTGSSLRTCTAIESAPSSRSITKQYVITVDP